MCDHPSGVGARVPVGSLPCGYLANLCPVWLPDGSLSRCISGVAAKTRGKVTFFFCIISPFRKVFVPLLANCALIYLLHNSLKSKNIANFAPTNALVAELVDAPDLGSGVSRRAGSSPVRRTNKNPNYLIISGWGFCFYVFAELLRDYLYKPRQKCHNINFNILFSHIKEKTTLQLCFLIKISYLCRRNGNSQI